MLRAGNALLGAACAALLLLATWLLALHVTVFEHLDQSVFRGFYDLGQHGTVASIAAPMAGLCNPKPYVYLVGVPVLIALARRRFRLAVAIGAILLGANVTTELLKALLAQPRAAWLLGGVSPVDPASWPSGHATAVMSLALCMILAVAPRLRPVTAALGAALAVAVSYSFLALGWHYPSDVLGGYLVASTWTLLGVAALRSTELRRRRPREEATGPSASGRDRRVSLRAALTPPGATLALAVLLAGLLAVARPQEVDAYARAHGAFMVGAAAIGLLALALATGMMLALRR